MTTDVKKNGTAGSFGKNLLGGRHAIRPARDWKIMLAALAVFSVIVLAYDAAIYFETASGEMYVSVAGTMTAPKVNVSTLNGVVADFSARSAAIGKSSPPHLVDPSL
ncbi:MAG: hypothetical protein KGH93_00630 [Patescibacteria group bacterium]|nr:hypothetical protein [Patescibacteria group bacterium]MDE1945692.1 hypothetical protein [Patescibacteria group bacterium]